MAGKAVFESLEKGEGKAEHGIVDKEVAQERRKRVKDLIATIDDSYLVLAGELYEINKNDEFISYGYKSWEDYIQGDLTIGKRKVQYLVSIYKYITEQIHDPDIIAKIKPIGWSKLKELIQVIDDENFEYWIKMAQENNVQKLSKLAQVYYDKKMKDGKAPSKKEMREAEAKVETTKFMTLSLGEEQYENVHDAIGIAKDMSGSDVISNNMSLICLEFVTSHGEKIGKKGEERDRVMRNSIRSLEKTFGIHLIGVNSEGTPFYNAEMLSLEDSTIKPEGADEKSK